MPPQPHGAKLLTMPFDPPITLPRLRLGRALAGQRRRWTGRQGLLPVRAEEVPEPSRVHDSDGRDAGDIQQVSVAGHQHVRATLDRGGYDPLVSGVTLWQRGARRGLGGHLVLPKKLVNLLPRTLPALRTR